MLRVWLVGGGTAPTSSAGVTLSTSWQYVEVEGTINAAPMSIDVYVTTGGSATVAAIEPSDT